MLIQGYEHGTRTGPCHADGPVFLRPICAAITNVQQATLVGATRPTAKVVAMARCRGWRRCS